MASLPSRKCDTGYLGTGSGSSLMESISHLLPEQPTLAMEGALSTNRRSVRVINNDQPNILILERRLSDTSMMKRLIDAYFVSYNRAYPILHEPTFRERYQSRHQIQASSSWNPIFYMVLAIGSWITGADTEPDAYDFYAAARSHMSLRMLEVGNILTVQAFLLMGNYLQKRDRPNTGYNFIGMAYRMALGLGLHREPPSAARYDTLLHERRRVLWWIVYSFDSGFSLTTGRPVMASDSFIETRLPRNIDDSKHSMNSTVPTPVDHPTNYSAVIAQSQLASISNQVFHELFSATSHHSFDMKLPRSIEHRLKVWRLSLPTYFATHKIPDWFRGPRAVVLWKEQNVRMLLWWGSHRVCSSMADRNEALNACEYTAMETIQSITSFCRESPDALHPGLSWYATYFLFQAALVLNIFRLQEHPVEVPDIGTVTEDLWLLSVTRAHDCLKSLSQVSKPASRCLEVLERIKHHCQSRHEPSSLPVSTSATGVLPNFTSMAENTLPDVQPAAFAADPALQIFLENTSLEADPFEGIEGFPGTQELELFDYLPLSTYALGDHEGSSVLFNSATNPP
ncbi:fungal-specific transcription factor domain-containing protein [Aspergillus bertholletiae]|uniref:Fungal-specific transcription factor domain-containing protein n=1 Tax=Aspergillus bertholletiae TaxID=1226010 RepID=A0A5N7AUN0_9EURO|nr:fungal-specific transcription factor domain-containing protein [Aspergillus bertholletiae]